MSRNVTLVFGHRKHFYFLILGLFPSLFVVHAEPQTMYSTAFYYGKNLPLDLLANFQRVVVEPDNTTRAELAYLKTKAVLVYAYLSIGEVGVDRSWIGKLDKSWILGRNKDWNSRVLDMSSNGWRDFLNQNRAEQIWKKGYQGFFLDTMDSYRLFAKTPAASSAQLKGVRKLIREMKTGFPGLRLLFNRGFDILDEFSESLDGVVAESLFSRWNPQLSRYEEVSLKDREWLITKLAVVRNKYKLPVTVIDYLPANQRDRAKKIAAQIADLGFTPWVSTIELNEMGVGLGTYSRSRSRDSANGKSRRNSAAYSNM